MLWAYCSGRRNNKKVWMYIMRGTIVMRRRPIVDWPLGASLCPSGRWIQRKIRTLDKDDLRSIGQHMSGEGCVKGSGIRRRRRTREGIHKWSFGSRRSRIVTIGFNHAQREIERKSSNWPRWYRMCCGADKTWLVGFNKFDRNQNWCTLFALYFRAM